MMTGAANAILAALEPGQRTKATFEFEDEAQRTDWAYFPRDHVGLPLLAMSPSQQKLTHALVAGALSLPAYARTAAIMALESVLNLLEERRADAVRDPGRYFVSVFGTPGAERWGWRFEGHHVSLNFALLDGEVVSTTPLFFGANPAEVRHGSAVISRPCGEEEDLARALLASLSAEQASSAVSSETAPPDFVLMNVPIVPDACRPGEAGDLTFVRRSFDALSPAQLDALAFDRTRPKGLPASAMSAAQRDLLSTLIGAYVERVAEPLAAAARARVAPEGLDGVHFAWAGERERRRPHYYRVQGPSLLIEYDNTQNEANHVHAVWREPDGDFGLDALRAHLRREH